ncbi:hypothetical protein GJAV_G00270520 [Gymnothorax javanicus]|nr:hypothetical protein GJAV_G00270520 [Gymnothorax javanicus]
MFDSRSNDYFQIDPQTGGVTTLQPLDRELKDTHVFKVTATDSGTPPRSGTAYLTVTVSDKNDHGPVFEQTQYRVSIRENVEIGFEVLTIRATDADAPSNANMIYKIINNDGVNSGFEIDPRNGLVKIKVSPDRETLSQYQLIVEANDQGKEPGPRSATATVHVTIEDENDNYPQFSRKRYVVQVPENVALNSKVAKVEASDRDEGTNARVHYSIISGNLRGQFYIDSTTGVIDLSRPLDYEETREYNLRIKAQDGGRPPLINATGVVVVRVVDVNDNAPMFVSTPFQASVLESVSVGQSVLHIQAIDSDSGDNARLAYRLVHITPGFPFTINNSSGWIAVAAELDRETTELYSFHVEARDHGVPALTSSASVSITVMDVNDNVPTFTQRVYELKLNEDVAVGSSVLAVTAVDRDANAAVTYQISGGNTRNRFAITSQSAGGLITLAHQLDYKQERQFVLTVTASDGLLYDTAAVYINVTDANTHGPVFQNANYQVLLSEDKPIGSTVVVISATDQDAGENARITYFMEDNVPQFQIDPDSGTITTRTEIDYEDQASYTLAVVARDNGVPQKSDTTYVEIIVLDANDNPPQFLQNVYQGSVREDVEVYTSVVQIVASDRDSGSNGRVSYTFQGGDDGDGDFLIEPYSGIIRTARKLDRENVPAYKLQAYAVDKGVPSHKASVEIQVQVQDINDNAPVFEKDQLDIFVEENSDVGSVVAQIVASDPDEGPNAQIIYQIVEGNVPEVFQLDIFNGDLIPLTDLDYESRKEYVIVVQATSAPLVSRATVHIHLIDINDNEPILKDFTIIFNNYVTNKSSSFPTGIIGKIPARDPDVSDKLHYSFVEGNELLLLILNPDTGDLRLSKDLDNNRALTADMKVSVTDGLNVVTAVCTLQVTIVTDDMLTNSITVRLENMSQDRFLSPLLSHFAEGVAAVLSTSPDRVFIFNIQNDTDVHGSILNVTFSALAAGGHFVPSEELQEQIYLNRTLLTRVSAQRVLPFDDNICLREPCENYMKCISVLRFDSSAPFIASDTVLFRPIHPVNGLRCRCRWVRRGLFREGGYTCECLDDFTGERCEVNARSGRCVPGVCKNGGQCVDLLVGGFMCQCPEGEFEKPYCRVSTRSFPGQSFVTFRGLKQRFHFTVSFMFATRERNALLLYNGRFNEKHDFIALEIIDEQIQLTFSTGETKTTVSPIIPSGVSDGQWHTVQLHYYNKDSLYLLDSSGVLHIPLYTAWLELTHQQPNIGRLGVPQGPSGEKVAVVAVDDCDIAMAVRFGGQIGNYSCAAQGTQTGQKKSLDLTGPLLLGGIPDLPEDFPVRNRDFVGCMSNLTIDSKPMDMAGFIANNGTMAGCPAKRNFCTEKRCQNGGVCVNQWNSYSCDCPINYGGKNCEQAMLSPLLFDGQALVSWADLDVTIGVPWYLDVMFRTRRGHGLLMQVNAGDASQINLLVRDRLLCFQVLLGKEMLADAELPQVRVNDGQWHHVRVELSSTKEGKDTKYVALVSLDYGLFQRTAQIGNELPGQRLKSLFVGGVTGSNSSVLHGFQGCIQGVRMGETVSYTANVNIQQGHRVGVEEGCDPADPCGPASCPEHSRCSDAWNAHTCVCEPGYFGKDCVDACKLNPCEHVSTCVRQPSSAHGYACQCGNSYYGRYCEKKLDQPCARGWWGNPVCGPCGCDVNKGFYSDCNKTTGECRCKNNYYRPEGGDTCFPCDCYRLGAVSRTCDPLSGQCPCKPGVIGRQCNQCDNPFAEVTANGCQVVYEGCPKAFDLGIWWPKAKFGRPAAVPCPQGSVGTAVRHCNEKQGWQTPELLNCTSLTFSQLAKMSDELLNNKTVMDGPRSESTARLLRNATEHTRSFYRNDLKTANHLLSQVLSYESRQQGFLLTATRDAQFNQNIVRAGSTILDPSYKEHWELIQRSEEGSAKLMRNFEEYASTVAKNMKKTYLKPFTIVTDNMILAVDYLDASDPDRAMMPRFHEIQEAFPKDMESSVLFPKFTVDMSDSRVNPTEEPPADLNAVTADGGHEVSERKRRQVEGAGPLPVAVVIIYKNLARLLPERYDSDRRSLRLPSRPVINTAVVSAAVHSERGPLTLERPLTLQYRLLETEERSKPVCVFWNHSLLEGGTGGWSSRGCELAFRNDTHVSCRCSHMTSFAVLMDVSKREHGDVLPLRVVTYACLGVALGALFLVLVLLIALRALSSNLHSIHSNLLVALFLALLTFVIGINRTDTPMLCSVVAMLLHYFPMCSFAWLFVEALHLHRMLTEVRDIDHSRMRFYYVMGWGFPAIITGLAMGLDPQGFGNADFCWLSIHDTLIWSFLGPIAVVLLVNIVVFVLAGKASCGRRRRAHRKSGVISALRGALALLLLISATWLLGLLAVNSDVLTYHYLFAIFSCLLGLFAFLFYIVLNKDVRRNLKAALQGKKTILEDSTTTRTSLLTRSLNYSNAHTDEGALFRSPIGESTVSMESTVRSGQSHGSSRIYTLRDGSNQRLSGSSSMAKAARGEGEPALHRRRSKRRGSGSDSELSGEERSSSFASSRSESEEDGENEQTKWNNERQPLHSTPRVDAVSNHVKPYWPVGTTTCSDSEDMSRADELKVESKVKVDLHAENKLNGDPPQPDKGTPTEPPGQQVAPSGQLNSQPKSEQRKGILKNKISYPPPLADKNMKNRLREKLSDYAPPSITSRTPSAGSTDGVFPVTGTNGILIKQPLDRPNGVAMTLQGGGINGGHASDSDGSNETSI